MVRKRKAILDVYKEHKASFLDAFTILTALEERGFKMSKRGLSNFVRNNLENKYLVPSRNARGTILGWALVESA